ncbi:hypothetical protein X777_01060 [Ooceraea biroi]|uniref:Uncharacterized protein n=1 Tax=Ooceraea biroi TaxID=2015173 RepID=A0A026WQW6_OOCBI|nr:hypothetical protein X777_01060 [Ooceraea biroi]
MTSSSQMTRRAARYRAKFGVQMCGFVRHLGETRNSVTLGVYARSKPLRHIARWRQRPAAYVPVQRGTRSPRIDNSTVDKPRWRLKFSRTTM